jgi:predicted RecB family nuclease
MEHERTVLKAYTALVGESGVVKAKNITHTQDLMAAKTPVIYQPAFASRLGTGEEGKGVQVRGIPDFLVLRGDGQGYTIVDAKLASSLSAKGGIKMQMAVYRQLCPAAVEPPLVALGTGLTTEVGSDPKIDRLTEAFLTELPGALHRGDVPAAAFTKSKCQGCPYDWWCRPRFEEAGELSLLPGIEARAAVALRARGIHSIMDVAALREVPAVAYLKGEEQRRQVLAQAKSFLAQRVVSVSEGVGAVLPEGPYLHFDVEMDPVQEDGASSPVYLWGLLRPSQTGAHDPTSPACPYEYDYVWTEPEVDAEGSKRFNADRDKQAFEAFLGLLQRCREQMGEDTKLVHYSPLEVRIVRDYAKRYDLTEHDQVQWVLDANNTVDLLPIVKAAFAFPTDGFGLKEVCCVPTEQGGPGFQWSLAESGSVWSIGAFHQHLQDSREGGGGDGDNGGDGGVVGDGAKLDDEVGDVKSVVDGVEVSIGVGDATYLFLDELQGGGGQASAKTKLLRYNCDDVLATRALEVWLRSTLS